MTVSQIKTVSIAALGSPPIRCLHQVLPPRGDDGVVLVAADVEMLVTSLRDGMNLVAKEYVACQFEEDRALALSEFTGATTS